MAGCGEPCTQLHHSLLGTMASYLLLEAEVLCWHRVPRRAFGNEKCLKGTLEQTRTCQEDHCLLWGRKQEVVGLAGSASCNSLEARSPDLEEGKEQETK